MPGPGGSADKFGNHYETLWSIDQLLRIVEGRALRLTLEPLEAEKSRGIEFVVGLEGAGEEYWSVKRQTAKASGWTLALLAERDDRGRSILSDLFAHVERADSNAAVFASTLAAPDLDELRTYAGTPEILKSRLALSQNLASKFREYLLPLCKGDEERARSFLLRVRTHTADEAQLKDRVNFAIRKIFYSIDGTELDVDGVRAHLSELLLANISGEIDRRTILTSLASRQVGLREWSQDKSVRDRIEYICDRYVDPLRSEFINGKLLLLSGSDQLQTTGLDPAKRLLVVAGAGGGKSSTLAAFVQQLRSLHVPVLALRFDRLSESILTTKELGRSMLLPESPALTLAGMAVGSPCVLVIDQLDAVSSVSGRKTEMWSLFEELHAEVGRLSNMSLVVGCREFDLENDYRIRKMKTGSCQFEVIKLGDLSPDQVESSLREAGTDPGLVQSSLKPILSIPLHLSLFLRLPADVRVAVHNRDELFNSFWIECERRVNRRLNRKSAWTAVIDTLANWLSEEQEMSAPFHVLDDLSQDAAAMASEHFLLLSENRYSFVHESLFDYSFARRFSAKGKSLLDLLVNDDQQLFRRAQVRQILTFLRAQDRTRYLRELKAVLKNPKVRFHIKRLVFQWLSSLPDPAIDEWQVLKGIFSADPVLKQEFVPMTAGKVRWFDVLDEEGFFESVLRAGEEAPVNEVISLFAFPQILESRSRRVAELIRQHQRPGEPWRWYLWHIYRAGAVFHSREMFDLFLSHIDDGTLDGARPGVAVNDGWWSLLYLMSHKKPDLACEAIAHWFDRRVKVWRSGQQASSQPEQDAAVWRSLRDELARGGQHLDDISRACAAPDVYARLMLPQVAALIAEMAKDYPNRLKIDPLWGLRIFSDSQFQIHDAIFEGLAKCLEVLAITDSIKLDELLKPLEDSGCDSIAFLILRAWTAAPEIYADRIADYLVSDPRRLKVGYSAAGSGSFENHISVQALRAASPTCTSEHMRALEQAILTLADDGEAKHPQLRGRRQMELLDALSGSRLSASVRVTLRELKRKFPTLQHEDPVGMRGGLVGPPISDDAQNKMSDEHWLSAMRKYSGVHFRNAPDISSAGGEHQLAISLMSRAQAEPARFAALANKMPDDFPASYFDAILNGIAASLDTQTPSVKQHHKITPEQLAALVRRVHSLPEHPCGRAIAWLFEKGSAVDWDLPALDVLVWHAVNDPQPTKDEPRKEAVEEEFDTAFGKKSYKPDPHSRGINSARGGAAEAIGRLLLDKPHLIGRLEPCVVSVAHDSSVAVKSCAVLALLATLNIDCRKAIALFKDCIADDPILLGTPHVRPFIHYAAHRDRHSIWPVIESMLKSDEADVVKNAALEVCLLGLDFDDWAERVQLVERGSIPMREAAAMIYAANVAHHAVGPMCCRKLKPFFVDSEVSVRTQAALAFNHIATLDTTSQADLLSGFLNSNPGAAAMEVVVYALENSNVQLPDLVCRLGEKCIETHLSGTDEASAKSNLTVMGLSKIILRLYAHTKERTIRLRCLNIIDDMERHHFPGITEELQRIER
jgi:hypothetical protein